MQNAEVLPQGKQPPHPAVCREIQPRAGGQRVRPFEALVQKPAGAFKIFFRQMFLQQFIRYCFYLAVFKAVEPGFKTHRLQKIVSGGFLDALRDFVLADAVFG